MFKCLPSKNNNLILKRTDKKVNFVKYGKYFCKIILWNISQNHFLKSSVVDEKHLIFIIGIEKKLTNLPKQLIKSETISEID